MGFKQTYRILILICIAFSAGFIIFHFSKDKTSGDFMGKYRVCFKLLPIEMEKNDSNKYICLHPKFRDSISNDTIFKSISTLNKDSTLFRKINKADLEWMSQKRLTNYEKNIKSLHNTLLNVVVITMMGVLLIFYKPKGINVSFLSIHIPETLLYIVVILGSLYLWANLGLLLNSAIDSRLALSIQFEVLNSNFIGLNYNSELSHILADYSIVDNWCGHFFSIFENGGTSLGVLSNIGLFGIFGLLISLCFAVMFITAIELGYRKEKLEGLSVFLILLSISLVITSCVAWIYKHNYSAYYVSYVWLLTAIFIFIWKRFRTTTINNLSTK